MFLLHRPSESEIIQYLLDQRDASFSYSDVGASKDELPSGFRVDRQRTRLGDGEAAFDCARIALTEWKMYPSPFSELCFPDRPIVPGTIFAAMINVGPIWSLNPCRIVYVIDEETSAGVRRFGFAIGTLPDHAECGEERFLVEWHQGDDSVWYDLLAFSRPYHIFAKVLYPYVRWLQHRFQNLSMQSMQAACGHDRPTVRAEAHTTSGTGSLPN
jgi:uncharacterized protein (UPF0548 family)